MNNYEKIIFDNRIQEQPCLAQHLTWERIADTMSDILTGLLGREVAAGISRYQAGAWAVDLSKTPLNAGEHDELLTAAEALGSTGEEQFVDDHAPLMELHQTFAVFLLGKALPFPVKSAVADSDGIWFFSEQQPTDHICLLIMYVETDLPTDILMLPCTPDMDKAHIKKAFADAVELAREQYPEPENSRLDRLDAALAAFEETTGLRPRIISADFECQLW